MIMKKTLIFIAAAALMASCGKKAQQADNQQDYTEESVEYILRDSTIYGFCGDGSAMNTLQLITDTGDTLTVGLERCRNRNRVLGGYAVGDEMAVILNADSTEATLVINKSVLHGDWVMPNPIDGSSETGIRILRGGLAESIDQSSIIYKSWRLFNGMLQIQATREDGIDMEEFQEFSIVKLNADSLVISDEEDTYEYAHPGVRDDEDLGIDLDDNYDDDFRL
jgi:hypothetical protein